jgi:virulence factor Mce-like protein
MRSRYNIVIVLVYMMIASTALIYMGYKMVGNCVLASCQTLDIELKDTAGLLPTNDVRMAGVTAGQVQHIKVQGKIAVVTVQIQQQYSPVYKDAHAIVRPKNLLGETYVEIDRGHTDSGNFTNGDTIKLINTITPVQVDEVLNALDPDTRTKLAVVVNSLGEATAARGQDMNIGTADLRRIAADVAVTSTSLNQQKDNIDTLLVQFDLMQKTAADYHAQLAQVLRDWNTTSTTLMAHDAQLASALGHLSNFLGDLDAAITPNTPALRSMVSNLPSTIDHANDFLDISTQIMQSFYNAPGAGNNTSQAFATTQPGTNPGSPIQDGLNLLPRLAQVMVGINTCDMHIYSNGYYNVPGVTESPSCANPLANPSDPNSNASNPSLSNEAFTGHPAPGQLSTDKHFWRIMGMSSSLDIPCGTVAPSTKSLIAGAVAPTPPPPPQALVPCSPQAGTNTGFQRYKAGSPAASVPSSQSSGGSSGGFLQQLWNDLTGGGRA